ncbi:MAG: hypothetical protein JWM85_400, partial [Acidimicrobiaceae bacterium]|nr:hypothetical protein [Acidimicrobiaceae bacterium]
SPEPLPSGTFATVEVTSAAPHHLSGQLRSVEGVPAPRRRPSIPVRIG